MKPLIIEVAIILSAVAGYVAEHPQAGRGGVAPLAAAEPAGFTADSAVSPPSAAMPERQVAAAGGAWVVPRSAVMHIRDCDYVIVKDGVHSYRRVVIQGRPLGSDRYAITRGLPQGLPVVTDSGVLFDQLASQG